MRKKLYLCECQGIVYFVLHACVRLIESPEFLVFIDDQYDHDYIRVRLLHLQ